MSTRARIPSGTSGHTSVPTFDPTVGALQVGYRELTATMAGATEPLVVNAWAIGFDGRSGAAVRYEDIKSIMGTVGGDGLAAISLTGITGNQFGSMSERNDLIGESSVTWISANADNADNRGAVLLVHDDTLIQILTVMPYPHSAALRSTYLLDAIASNMAARSPYRLAGVEPVRAGVMDRLPALDDLPLVLQDARIEKETYVGR